MMPFYFWFLSLFIMGKEGSIYTQGDKVIQCASQSNVGANWILVARQTHPDYWVYSWIDQNFNDSSSATFARWSTLEDHRGTDGYFKFKISYPTLADLIWKQTNNPTLEAQDNNTYIPISVPVPSNSSWYYGLGRKSAFALMSSDPPYSTSWESTPIGTTEAYIDGNNTFGIPSYGNNSQGRVELWVMGCTQQNQRRDFADMCTESAVAIDNCQNSNNVSGWSIYPQLSQSVQNFCPNTKTTINNWTATDSCLILSVAIQNVTVVDTIAPQITIPNDKSVNGCPSSWTPENTGFATATDDCYENPSITYFDIKNQTLIIRKWTASDGCTTSSGNQLISISPDLLSPTILNLPATYLAWCSYGNTIVPQVDDNCNASNIQLYSNHTAPIYSPNCPQDYLFSEIWTAIDENGNIAQKTVEIVVKVTSGLEWVYRPPNITVSCNHSLSDQYLGMGLAIDQCNRPVLVSSSDSYTPSFTCSDNMQPFEILRTFTTETRCGITLTHHQLIKVVSTKLPPPMPVPVTPTPTPKANNTCECVYGHCLPSTTTCAVCFNGYYGSTCSQKCSCQNGVCYDGPNGDGLCVKCFLGYFGVRCDSTCSCLNGICDEVTGLCLSCKKGYYGINCQSQCPCEICHDGIHGTGTCLGGPPKNVIPAESNSSFAQSFVSGVVGLLAIIVFLALLFLIGIIYYWIFKVEKFAVISSRLIEQQGTEHSPLIRMNEN